MELAPFSSCAGGGTIGQLPSFWIGDASKSGSAYSLNQTATGPYTYTVSPWGQLYNGAWYAQTAWSLPYTNGNATTPSKVTFNNTTVGTINPGGTPVKATGQLTFRQQTGGGLITLN
jgi:hypothetical protein